MRKEAEVVAKREQGILMHLYLSLGIKVGENATVLPKQTMNIPNKIIRIAVKSVVVVVPALIRAEFLIGAATYGVAAIETFFFHSTNVLLKIQKNVFKRLQTNINDSEANTSIYIPIHFFRLVYVCII